MTTSNKDRLIGNTPISDAAAANAPDTKVASNADYRVSGEGQEAEPAEDLDGEEDAA